MKAVSQFGKWLRRLSLAALLAIPAMAGQRNQPPRSVPKPQAQPKSRNEAPRPQNRPQQSQPQYAPRTYSPPAQGHHSGQWLNQHREQPLDQQKRTLENDPQFRRLPQEKQQKLEQRLQRFDSLPPDRQQQVLRRMETWEHLTPQQ